MNNVAALLLTLCAIPVFAQEPAPTFDVASIKRSDPDAPGGSRYRLPGGRFRVLGLPLVSLISFSYDVPANEISEFPKWAATDRFDIEAVGDLPVESDVKKRDSPRLKAMVRQLLAERFQLNVRREERNVPTYSLVVSTGGPKMEHNAGKAYGITVRKRGYIFQRVSMADLVRFLSTNLRKDVGRVVVDKTGLQGDFDFQLTWAQQKVVSNTSPTSDSGPGSVGEALPSLFAAIQEQLGLKLQADHGLVPFLVVAKASPPSEN